MAVAKTLHSQINIFFKVREVKERWGSSMEAAIVGILQQGVFEGEDDSQSRGHRR